MSGILNKETNGQKSEQSTASPSSASLVLALLRAHRPTYTIMALAVFAASLLICGIMQVYVAASAHDGAERGHVGMIRRFTLDSGYDGASLVAGIALACCLLVSVFMVLASVSSLVQARRREYGLLRLAGASRHRIVWMELCEFGVPLACTACAGSLIGMALTAPLGRIFAIASGLVANDVPFEPRVRPGAAALSFVLVMAACLIGVWVSMHTVAKCEPLELMSKAEAKSVKIGGIRKVVSVLVSLAILVLVLAPLPSLEQDMRTMLLVLMVIVDAYLLSPVLVPRFASGVGAVAQALSHGSGLLARQRARRGVAGSVSVALPVVMLLTIVCSFAALIQSGSAGNMVLNFEPLKANVIVTLPDGSELAKLDKAVRGIGNETAVSAVYHTQSWAEKASGRLRFVTTGSYKDLANNSPRLSGIKVVEGNLKGLGPGAIAVNTQMDGYSPSQYAIGSSVTFYDRNDRPVSERIVAHVEPKPGFESLTTFDFLTLEGAMGNGGEDGDAIAAVTVRDASNISHVVDALRAERLHDGQVYTKDEFLYHRVMQAQSGQRAMVVLIAGGAALAAMFLMQSIALAVAGRRSQNMRLHQMGVLRGSIALANVLETILDVVAGVLVSLLAVAVVVLAVAGEFARAGIPLHLTPVPIGTFTLLSLGLLAFAVVVAVICSRTRTDSVRRA